jgi:hypothetical protein
MYKSYGNEPDGQPIKKWNMNPMKDPSGLNKNNVPKDFDPNPSLTTSEHQARQKLKHEVAEEALNNAKVLENPKVLEDEIKKTVEEIVFIDDQINNSLVLVEEPLEPTNSKNDPSKFVIYEEPLGPVANLKNDMGEEPDANTVMGKIKSIEDKKEKVKKVKTKKEPDPEEEPDHTKADPEEDKPKDISPPYVKRVTITDVTKYKVDELKLFIDQHLDNAELLKLPKSLVESLATIKGYLYDSFPTDKSSAKSKDALTQKEILELIGGNIKLPKSKFRIFKSRSKKEKERRNDHTKQIKKSRI